jgi:integration host factor subunit alpha
MTLTKDRIIAVINQKTGFDNNLSKNLTERLLEIMKRALADGEDILISGFGKFLVKKKRARRGRNPQTNQDLQLKARMVVVFKTSGRLRKKINAG